MNRRTPKGPLWTTLRESVEDLTGVVDDLTDGRKCLNLSDADVLDYMDKDDFLARIQAGDRFGKVDAVFHEGACSSTTEWDGRFVMKVNYDYTKALLA